MIVLTAYPIHEPALDRADRIAAAEDRAEQASFDVARERS